MTPPEPPDPLRSILGSVRLDGILRIDLGLEGDWNASVAPMWTRDHGFVGFAPAARSHTEHRPSLELYFAGGWVGVHCYVRTDGHNVVDEELARSTIAWIEATLAEPV